VLNLNQYNKKKYTGNQVIRDNNFLPSNKLKICMGHLQCNKYLFSQGSSDHQWMILLLTTASARKMTQQYWKIFKNKEK